MKVAELVDAAAHRAGSARKLAEQMRKRPSRLSEWKAGNQKPDATEIAYMAKVAGLPVLVTLALVEKDLAPETAQLWEEALGEAEAPSYWDKAAGLCILCQMICR